MNPAPDGPGEYGFGTEAAIRRFQAARHITVDGVCGLETWSALIEASWRIGDRLLYERSPMLRGDDVTDLQVRLSALGFDAGRVDGIFGPETASALVDFQRNAGLTTDGICGPEVVAALERLSSRGGTTTKAIVRDREALRVAPRQLSGRRIVIAEAGGLAALAHALGRALRDLGARTLLSHHPDGQVQADEANAFEAEAFLALQVRAEPGCHTAYWSTTGYESIGGRHLAELICRELADDPGLEPIQAEGMRLAVLRATRMPAVVCAIGPPAVVVEHAGSVTTSLRSAISQWIAEPAGV